MNNAFELTPCGPPEPCNIVDCDSDDDIANKDLTDLTNLNQGTAKAELVKENTNKGLNASKESKEGKGSQNERAGKKEQIEGNVEERGKKRSCRKIIKNPFFTNRLKFSMNLPPRPPLPPPQFFPLADEDSKPKICSKKKKCKKKKKSKTECNEDEECGLREKEKEEEEEEEEEEQQCEPCVCICGDDFDSRARKNCKKHKANKVYAPCRKKLSETSIPPQPRRIPALLKDLPLTCPRDIPEVERQVQMSQDNGFQRNVCIKKCKKKERVEQLLNLY